MPRLKATAIRGLSSVIALGFLGGCGHASPLAFPVVLAAQPFILTARAIDERVLFRLDNADIAVAGKVVDDEGRPVDGVTVIARTWTATHRDEGYADRWHQHEERHPAAVVFDLKFHNCQTVDLRFTKVGYFERRLVIHYEPMSSPSHEELDGTGDACGGGPAPHEYDLNGGGRLIEFGTVTFHPHAGPSAHVDVTLNLQPDGSRDLSAVEDANTVALKYEEQPQANASRETSNVQR